MSKTEVISKIAQEAGLTKTVVRQVLQATEEVAKKELRKADGVFMVPGLVKLTVVKTPKRAERQGRNPATGAKITIPEARWKEAQGTFLQVHQGRGGAASS